MKAGLIHGRNYVETVLLTLLQHELGSASIDTHEYVARNLELMIVALGTWKKHIMNIYKEMVAKILKQTYKDLVTPTARELPDTYLFDEVLNFHRKHIKKLFGNRLETMRMDDIDRELRLRTAQIIKTAALATLFKCGFVKVSE